MCVCVGEEGGGDSSRVAFQESCFSASCTGFEPVRSTDDTRVHDGAAARSGGPGNHAEQSAHSSES